MRYLVTARVKDGCRGALKRAIDDGTLGAGSVAGDEYAHDMAHARELADGRVKWVETCFCPTPLAEELPYWEAYFDMVSVKDAHARSRCRDENGTEPWACCDCDCTARLEGWLERQGPLFQEALSKPKSQIPKPKSQINPNVQIPTDRLRTLGFGIWAFVGIWDLGFGLWDLM